MTLTRKYMDWVNIYIIAIFFNKIDVVQNVSCHFEQSETTFRSPLRQSRRVPTRSISVGCDEGNFSFPEEYLFTKAVLRFVGTFRSLKE